MAAAAVVVDDDVERSTAQLRRACRRDVLVGGGGAGGRGPGERGAGGAEPAEARRRHHSDYSDGPEAGGRVLGGRGSPALKTKPMPSHSREGQETTKPFNKDPPAARKRTQQLGEGGASDTVCSQLGEGGASDTVCSAALLGVQPRTQAKAAVGVSDSPAPPSTPVWIGEDGRFDRRRAAAAPSVRPRPAHRLHARPGGCRGRPVRVAARPLARLLASPFRLSTFYFTRYLYKVASGHGTFEWSSVYHYNLRMDSGSQDYR